jgi:gliding motility-associated-like protein
VATTPVTSPSNGSVVISTSGAYQYTPSPGFVGQDTFSYRICDDGMPSLCDTAIVVITVLPDYNGSDNNPPFAGDDAEITDMNTPVTGSVILNDSDPNGDNITVNTTPVTPPSNGTVVLAPNGNFIYTPNPNFCGPDQFVYEICDDGTPSLCAQATVYITVQCFNDNVTTDTIPLTVVINTSIDTCVNLDEVPGTIVNILDLNCATPVFGAATVFDSCMTYVAGGTPGALDTVCVVVTDIYGYTDTTVYLITVTEQAASITPDTIPVVLFTNTSDTICIPAGDLTSAPISITNLGCAPLSYGTVTFINDSCMIYNAGGTPGAIDTVCVVLEDVSGNMDTTIFLVTVIPNDIDTVIANTNVDSTITVCADTTDLVGNIISATNLNCTTIDGTITNIDNNGCITYIAPSVAGLDTICLAICDDNGLCDTTIIIINTDPATDTIYSSVGTGTDITDCVDTTQLPGMVTSISICSQPANGTLTVVTGINGDTTCVTYVPNAGYVGTDTGCVVICDNQGYCDTTIIVYTVEPACATFNYFADSITLLSDDCLSNAELCLAVTPADLFGLDVYVDGVIQSALNTCNSDTLVTYDISTVPSSADNLDSWAVNGATFGPITYNNFQQVVDSMNVWNTAGNWTLNGTTITGGANNPTAYGDLIFSTFAGNQTQVPAVYDITVGGTAISLTSGVHQIVITNPSTLCSDTTVVTVSCTSADTVNIIMPVNDVVTLCPDDSQLAGPIVSMTNICSGSSDDGLIVFFPGATCFEFQSQGVAGIDTACIVSCDSFGNCDTTIYIFTIVPTPDTQVVNIIYPETDTLCLDFTQLPGNIISIAIGDNCDEPDNALIDIFSQSDTCIYITATDIFNDTTCIVYCDDQGFCDTTYIIINVTDEATQLPVAVNDTLEVCDVTAIEVLANDSLYGTLDTMYVLNEPYGGTYFVNFNNTISYTRVNIAPFVDSLSYVICNSVGCDTATVIIDIDCTEDVIVYTGFSPNGDNVNDFFTIEGLEDYPNNKVMIFNRWGNIVYDRDGYVNDWDGRWEGKDLPDGTYFYILEYTDDAKGETKKLSGYVQIHR